MLNLMNGSLRGQTYESGLEVKTSELTSVSSDSRRTYTVQLENQKYSFADDPEQHQDYHK